MFWKDDNFNLRKIEKEQICIGETPDTKDHWVSKLLTIEWKNAGDQESRHHIFKRL